MALQYYQQAAECADTTAADCDYAQLSRVYAQMSLISQRSTEIVRKLFQEKGSSKELSNKLAKIF